MAGGKLMGVEEYGNTRCWVNEVSDMEDRIAMIKFIVGEFRLARSSQNCNHRHAVMGLQMKDARSCILCVMVGLGEHLDDEAHFLGSCCVTADLRESRRYKDLRPVAVGEPGIIMTETPGQEEASRLAEFIRRGMRRRKDVLGKLGGRIKALKGRHREVTILATLDPIRDMLRVGRAGKDATLCESMNGGLVAEEDLDVGRYDGTEVQGTRPSGNAPGDVESSDPPGTALDITPDRIGEQEGLTTKQYKEDGDSIQGSDIEYLGVWEIMKPEHDGYMGARGNDTVLSAIGDEFVTVKSDSTGLTWPPPESSIVEVVCDMALRTMSAPGNESEGTVARMRLRSGVECGMHRSLDGWLVACSLELKYGAAEEEEDRASCGPSEINYLGMHNSASGADGPMEVRANPDLTRKNLDKLEDRWGRATWACRINNLLGRWYYDLHGKRGRGSSTTESM